MDSAVLRFEILQLLDRHESRGSSTFLEDKEIAPQLNVPITDVQRQLLILEDGELVMLAKAFGPSYGARLMPKGIQALEDASSQPAASARRIGF
jgi:hypothetical protein